jgi:hypothetical protein
MTRGYLGMGLKTLAQIEAEAFQKEFLLGRRFSTKIRTDKKYCRRREKKELDKELRHMLT